jgi:hypothetical protein
VNRTAVHLPVLYKEPQELTERYVRALEKTWAKRSQLAKKKIRVA